MDAKPREQMLTVKQIAVLASVCESTVRRAIVEGTLPVQRIRGRRCVRVALSEVNKWLGEGEGEGEGE